jgi:acetyl-CoA C-acetyltransferase
MGNTAVIDTILGALNDPFHRIPKGITVENLAASHGITRAQQDALALGSHRRASRASGEGRFREQILGIEVRAKTGTVVFDTDEHGRHDTTMENIAALRPVFQKDGTVTAGNASASTTALRRWCWRRRRRCGGRA